MDGDQTRLSHMRAERDKFLAFAFARADMLVEIDLECRIQFVSGAVQALTGIEGERLIGTNFGDLLSVGSRALAGELKSLAIGSHRLDDRHAQLMRGTRPLPIILAGCGLPERADRYYITVTVAPPKKDAAPGEVTIDRSTLVRDQATGLVEGASFVDIAKQRIAASRDRNEPLRMTMLELEGLGGLMDRLDANQRPTLLREVGSFLQEKSVDGDSAASLAEDKFSVLHDEGVSEDELRRELSALTKRVDPVGRGLEVVTTSLNLDASTMNDADAARALVYAVNKFADSQPGQFTIQSLSDGLQELLVATTARVSSFRSTLKARGFELVFQPIVYLEDRKIHHQEALTRLPDGSSPFDMVTFAEEVGFVAEFDLSVADQALSLLQGDAELVPIAVNVSGRSLESNIFVAELQALLKRYDKVRTRLSIEVTESARITNFEGVQNVLRALRESGQQLCLDDFGAGAAAFHYLRAFSVDVVKIDGSYVKAIESSERDRAFVRAIRQLCDDLKISTVAEMIESDRQATLLERLGITYGQGYLFGRPGRKAAHGGSHAPVKAAAPAAASAPAPRPATPSAAPASAPVPAAMAIPGGLSGILQTAARVATAPGAAPAAGPTSSPPPAAPPVTQTQIQAPGGPKAQGVAVPITPPGKARSTQPVVATPITPPAKTDEAPASPNKSSLKTTTQRVWK